MKIQKTDSGCYFVEPVCSDEEKLMEAISIAVKFFNESYYPKDEPYESIADCKQDSRNESAPSRYQDVVENLKLA